MCEAHAYIVKNGQEEMLLESVDTVELEGENVRLTNIFGEQRVLRAKLKSYSSSNGKLLFVPMVAGDL